MVLLTYDVDVTTTEGRSRLRRVAKLCESYGIRVQNSVFEMMVDPAQYVLIKKRLDGLIDKKTDSVRFYMLGKKWDAKVETLGTTGLIAHGETMIL
jgi:CRISPR-associated protein Cas2